MLTHSCKACQRLAVTCQLNGPVVMLLVLVLPGTVSGHAAVHPHVHPHEQLQRAKWEIHQGPLTHCATHAGPAALSSAAVVAAAAASVRRAAAQDDLRPQRM